MLQTHESLDLIARYLNNPTDKQLRTEILRFCSASPENEAYFLDMEKIWEQSSAAATFEAIDEKQAVQRFKKILKHNTPSRNTSKVWWTSIAASVVVCIIGYWAFNEKDQPRYLVKSTAKSQVDSVKLADGSVVIMAENTELKYPDRFESATREIFLTKGQAFFKIARDVNHPFKVKMKGSDVQVLGTTFNIKLSENKIELGVKTGKILFSPYKDAAASVLTAGQALSYDMERRQLQAKSADNNDAWLTKELVFVDTPLEEVCKELTAYYGVEIKLQSTKRTAMKLNAKFYDQNLNDVLSVLNETYNLKITKERNQINLNTP